MKNFILFFIILIGITANLAPFIDGYLFKQFYYEQIAFLQQEIQSNKNASLQIESYDLGWMQSTATLTITSTDRTDNSRYHIQPIVVHIKSIIHHGPLVYVNKKLQLAYAHVETSIYLPDILKPFIPQNEHGFMQIYSQVSLDGNTWTNHYSIPAISLNEFGNWNGLSGDNTIDLVDNIPVKINDQMIFGRLSVPALFTRAPSITIEPIQCETNATRQSLPEWNGSFKLRSVGLIAKWQDGRFFSLNNADINITNILNNNLYNSDTKVTIGSIQMPRPSPISTYSNITYTLSLMNVDINGLQNFKKYATASRIPSREDMLFKLLSPTSSVNMKTSMNTELGAASANLTIALLSLPKTKNEITAHLNANFNARVAQPLFDKILAIYLSQQSLHAVKTYPSEIQPGITPQTAAPQAQLATTPMQQAKTIISSLLQQGYILEDKNDYIVTISRKGLETTLNGKTISDSDLNKVWDNINRDVIKATTPPATTVPTTPILPATSSPANISPATMAAPVTLKTTPTSDYHCYWMESSSGKYQWVLTKIRTKSNCFTLDSCSGGMKQSGGGCYKWATSPAAKPESWDTSTPGAAQ